MASLHDRDAPSVAAVAIATALVSAVAGYYIGQASMVGIFGGGGGGRRAPAAASGKPAAHHEDQSDSSDAESEDEEKFPEGLDTFAGNNEECKLVLVVRTDLGMTKGKIAAQCSHATLACYKTLFRTDPSHPLLRRWERLGQAKVALKIDSEEDMLVLQAQAVSLGLCAKVIHDAGRTQIASGSATVLGIGPAPRSKVDEVTGHLKLL